MTFGTGNAAGTSTANAFPPLAPADPLATLLPPLRLPESCGAFLRDGHGMQKMPMFGDAPMQTGVAKRRRIYLGTPRKATVSLEVSLQGVADFYAWFEGPLAAGVNFFAAEVANQGPGLLWFKALFLTSSPGDPPYTVEYLGGLWWKITANLMLFGDGSVTGPAPTALTGGVLFDLIGTAALTVLQPISGGVTFALVPVAAGSGMLSGGALMALLLGVYFPPAPVGYAAGTSTANAVPTDGFVGHAAGTSTAAAQQAGWGVGNAAGTSNAIAGAVTQGLTYPDERGTWVATAGAITVPINDIPVYFKRARTIVGVSLLTLGGLGSCVVDIQKVPIGSYPPTAANSICAAAKPTIVAGRTYVDTTLTGWTLAVAAGDTLLFHLDSSSTFTLVAIKLHFQET